MHLLSTTAYTNNGNPYQKSHLTSTVVKAGLAAGAGYGIYSAGKVVKHLGFKETKNAAVKAFNIVKDYLVESKFFEKAGKKISDLSKSAETRISGFVSKNQKLTKYGLIVLGVLAGAKAIDIVVNKIRRHKADKV